jgi:hypothetical protein
LFSFDGFADKKLVLKFHPDKMKGSSEDDSQAKNEAQFVCIQKGY